MPHWLLEHCERRFGQVLWAWFLWRELAEAVSYLPFFQLALSVLVGRRAVL